MGQVNFNATTSVNIDVENRWNILKSSPISGGVINTDCSVQKDINAKLN